MEQRYEEEIRLLQEQITECSSHVSKDKEFYQRECEKLKVQVQDMDRELSDVQSCYERDKALWEGKFTFLEQQREQAKHDLEESQHKFELTLHQLQKRGNMEKDKMENNQQALINTIENKYKTQLREQVESTQRMQSELSSKIKNLERENRTLNDKLHLEQRDKMSDHGNMEKKLQEIQESERRLNEELDEVKCKRDTKILEYQRTLEKERENYKTKIFEIEGKLKEAENKRGALVF